MNTNSRRNFKMLRQQTGVAAVEFALVSLLFFTLLIGIMEMGRILFYWNAAAEATRWGSRLAVVCDFNDSIIKAKMRTILPVLTDKDIQVTYEPAACASDSNVARASCRRVTVEILPTVDIQTFIPLIPTALTIPAFSTTLPRESMDSASGTNPVCG